MKLVTNQDMDIVKECVDEDEAIDYIMDQSEDEKLEIYTPEEYERFTNIPLKAPLEAFLIESKGEEEIDDFEGNYVECVKWAKKVLAKRSHGCVEIGDPETGKCLKTIQL